MTFQPEEELAFVNVTILNDDVLEGVETFKATLTTEDSGVDILTGGIATVTITDNDSMLCGYIFVTYLLTKVL